MSTTNARRRRGSSIACARAIRSRSSPTRGLRSFPIPVPARVAPEQSAIPLPSVDQLHHELGELTKTQGSTRRQALKVLAGRYGTTVNELYKLLGTGNSYG